MNISLTPETQKRLEKSACLPSIPQIVAKIKEISEDPKSSVADLANCILSDHQLTSRILRMANSAYYGDFAGKVKTITHAIVLMGFRAVRNIAISMSVYGAVSRWAKDSGFDLISFWTRSIGCGVIAKFLAGRAKKPELIEAAFIAGFMHDIGQVLLAGLFPADYRKISTAHVESADVYITERALLDLDHMVAGEYVGTKWNLPNDLKAVIADHHRECLADHERSQFMLVDLVYLSDRIYAHMMSGGSPEATTYQPIVKSAQQLIGVSSDDMADLLDSCREQITEIASELEIDIEREFDRPAVNDGDPDLQRELNTKEVQLAFLQNASGAFTETEKADEVLAVLCETIYRGMQLGRVIVFEHSLPSNAYLGNMGFGMESQQKIKELALSTKAKLICRLREGGTPITILGSNETMYADLISAGDIDELEADAFFMVPMSVLGEMKYVIFCEASNPERPLADEAGRTIAALASQAAMAIERSYYKALAGR